MQQTSSNAATHQTAAFFSLINHPVKFRLYLLKNLPAGYFSGLKIVHANPSSCAASIPFKWLTQNPFRSTYFASLSMAAELSTGVLAMAQVYKRKPAVSMLVTGIEGKFYKKATGLTIFQCDDGGKISDAVANTISSKTAQEVKAHSVGKNKEGEVVAEFWITWSFKAK
ncbi:MAG TPA: DUF4442 domain-containing protein [Flavisolibacter sp.]|nr:DUF4442 domain-containing protein [Flavisolibacter sp.]